MRHDRLWQELERRLPAAYELRRELHQMPDLSGKESGTLQRVLQELPPGVEINEVASTGAVVRMGGPGPAIGLRGELDALPIREDTGVSWASRRPGIMHACGHDVNLAAVTAVMHAVNAAGEVPLLGVFQPREETYPSGAEDIAASRILESEDCQFMLGAHVQPTLDPGVVACVPGGVNAASDEFAVEISGRSGHAAYPHLTADPLLAAAQIVVGLQSVVSRSVDPMHSAVVGVSSFLAGEAANAVPGDARILGILRALDEDTRALIRRRLTEMAASIARAHECFAEVTITQGEPVLYNDPALVGVTQRRLQGRGISVSESLRSLGADDFSFFAEHIPSLMLFVGTNTSARLHSSSFLPTDEDLKNVAQALMAGYLGATQLTREEQPSHEHSVPGHRG